MLHPGEKVDDPGLTGRERQILELIACGMSAKQIAQEVGIAPRTVERHIENCRHKMRARNKTHLIAKAVTMGELKLDGTPTLRQRDDEPNLFEFKPRLIIGE